MGHRRRGRSRRGLRLPLCRRGRCAIRAGHHRVRRGRHGGRRERVPSVHEAAGTRRPASRSHRLFRRPAHDRRPAHGTAAGRHPHRAGRPLGRPPGRPARGPTARRRSGHGSDPLRRRRHQRCPPRRDRLRPPSPELLGHGRGDRRPAPLRRRVGTRPRTHGRHVPELRDRPPAWARAGGIPPAHAGPAPRDQAEVGPRPRVHPKLRRERITGRDRVPPLTAGRPGLPPAGRFRRPVPRAPAGARRWRAAGRTPPSCAPVRPGRRAW